MLWNVEMRQTRVFQDALRQGREEGREEDRKRGRSETIVKLLSLQLGNLSAELVSRIEALSDEQLDSPSDRFLELESIDNLNDYIESVSPERDATKEPETASPDGLPTEQ